MRQMVLPLFCLPWPCGSGEGHGFPLINGYTHLHFQVKQIQLKPVYMTKELRTDQKCVYE